MRLDNRYVRFVPPFWPSLARKVRLAGRRGVLHLQETALVAEAELIRFSFFGVEWLFRRALSEWTTVTVPYSRIIAMRYRRLYVFRALSLLVVLGSLAFAAFVAIQEQTDVAIGMAILTLILAILLGYVNWRIQPYYRVTYRGKDGRRYLLTFRIRERKLRQRFVDTLTAHRSAAAKFMAPSVAAVASEKVRWFRWK